GGGEVNNSIGILGVFEGSEGIASVTGTGSKWNSYLVDVGSRGSGKLAIEAGGQVVSCDSYLGGDLGSTGTATITDADSQWI
ncbi:hypothetical protein DF186_21855, partial [Enterococcus hirae]